MSQTQTTASRTNRDEIDLRRDIADALGFTYDPEETVQRRAPKYSMEQLRRLAAALRPVSYPETEYIQKTGLVMLVGNAIGFGMNHEYVAYTVDNRAKRFKKQGIVAIHAEVCV